MSLRAPTVVVKSPVSPPSSAVVQTAGYGYRLDRHVLKAEFDRAGALQRLLLRMLLCLQPFPG